jgi:hypothetical protein
MIETSVSYRTRSSEALVLNPWILYNRLITDPLRKWRRYLAENTEYSAYGKFQRRVCKDGGGV